MVYTSYAILSATLALSAAAPILAVPLFSTLGGTFLRLGNGGHGHLVRAPVTPPVPEPAPAAAPAAAAVAKAPSKFPSKGGAAAIGLAAATLLGGGTYGFVDILTSRAIDDEIYLAARARMEGEASANASGGFVKSPLGPGILDSGATSLIRSLPHRELELEARGAVGSAAFGRDLDTHTLRLLLNRNREDHFARSFDIDELD